MVWESGSAMIMRWMLRHDLAIMKVGPKLGTLTPLRTPIAATNCQCVIVVTTKAAVPANKFPVGVASYGSGFRMELSTIRQCTWTGSGSQSEAYAGR